MGKLINFMDSKVMPIAVKIGQQRYVVAITNAMMSLVGIIIVASMATLVQNLQFGDYQTWLNTTASGQVLWSICQNIVWGCLNMYGIMVGAVIGKSLWSSRGHQGNEGIGIAMACYFITIPYFPTITQGDISIGAYGWMHFSNFSASSLFTCMLVAIVSVELLHKLSTIKALKIKMPEQVPPMVANSFSTLIPTAITVIIFAILTFAITTMFDGKSLNDIIVMLISAPIQGLSNNIFTAMLIPLLVSFLWFFGIHGSSIVGTIVGTVFASSAFANIEMYANGVADLSQYNIITPEFIAAFVYMGGGGCTIALIIALFIVNRRRNKVLLSLATPTGLFNINEPLIFGLPIVLNPMLFIPFVIGPAILGGISYLAIASGLVHPVVATVPWTTPPIIRAYLATGMHWSGAALAAFNLVVMTLIYLPFVYMMDKRESDELSVEKKATSIVEE